MALRVDSDQEVFGSVREAVQGDKASWSFIFSWMVGRMKGRVVRIDVFSPEQWRGFCDFPPLR